MTYMGTKVFVLKTQNIDSDSCNTLFSLQLSLVLFCILHKNEVLNTLGHTFQTTLHIIFVLFLEVKVFSFFFTKIMLLIIQFVKENYIKLDKCKTEAFTQVGT